MTIEHSVLTGSSLHEPKGIASQVAGLVYVSNGAGSGTWTTISNPFSTGLLHVRDQVASGTASQSITSASWQQRRLQTVVTNEIVGAALGSGATANQIVSLPSGTYWTDGRVCWHSAWSNLGSAQTGGISVNRIRLRNITDGSDILLGLNNSNESMRITVSSLQFDGNMAGFIPISGRFTIGAPKTIELQHWITITNGTAGGGTPSTAAAVAEVYADLMIWKLI